MEDYIQLYQTLDGYAEQNGGYEYEVPPRKGQVQPTPMYPVYSGEIIMDSRRSEPPRLTDNKVSISVTYNQSAFTATTMVTSGGELYYAILRRDINIAQDGQAYPGDDKIYQLCSGNSIDDLWNYGIAYIIERDGLWNGQFEFVIDFTGGFYCTYEESDDMQYFSKKFAKSQTTTEITVNDQTLQAYTFTSDNLSTYGVQDENENDRYAMFKESGDTYVFFGNIDEIVINKKYRDFIKTPVPAVAYIEDADKVVYNYIYPKLYKVTVTYNVTSTDEPWPIVYKNGMPCNTYRAVVDGTDVIWDDIPEYRVEHMEGAYYVCTYGMDSGYTFETTGLHTIEYYIAGNKIFDSSFYQTAGITEVIIGEGIEIIGDSVFNTLGDITAITFPSTLKKSVYGWNHQFHDCNFQKVNFNGTVEQWIKIQWGNGVAGYPLMQGNGMFYMNDVLVEDLYVPASASYDPGPNNEHYTQNWFQYCSSITSITFEEGFRTMAANAFTVMPNLKTVHLPNSIDTSFSFSNCTSLTTINIPNTLTAIPGYAFERCSSLTGINLPNALTVIGPSAFYRCTSLSSITFGPNLTTISASSFASCTTLASIFIPDNVVNLGEKAFASCSTVSNITLGNGLSGLPSYAFVFCGILENVTVGSGLRTTGSSFWQCSISSSFTIDSNAIINCKTWSSGNSLGNSITNTFFCGGIKKLVLGEHISNIPADAFCKLSQITEMHCLGTTPPTVEVNAFRNIKTNGVLYVPTGCTSAYQTFKSRLSSGWTIVEE